MLFNFIIVNADAARLMTLEDTLRPLIWGLREAGHRVVAFGRRFEALPAINLIVQGTTIESFRQVRARAANDAGADACIGLLCPDDVSPDAEREALLRQSLDQVRFIWTGTPTPMADDPALRVRIALIEFGFHPALAGPQAVPDARREVGVVLYGRETPYRASLAARLTEAIPRQLFVRPGHFPDYIVSDLLSRAALVVVTRGDETEAMVPQARIAKALCNSTAVVSEAGPVASPLAPYATQCPYAEIVARCKALVGAEGRAMAGAQSLARFRQERAMAKGIEAAVAAALAAAGG